MNKRIVITASVFGILAVILGAFGAHGLQAKISLSELDIWKTAVQYHFYHVFALLFLSLIPSAKAKFLNWSYWCFTIGILLFSGSLYLLATKSITGLPVSFLGPITPIGGLFFILGWFGLLFYAIKTK